MLVAYKHGKDHIFEEVTAITFHSNGIMKGIDIVLLCRDGSTKTVMTGISEGTAGKIRKTSKIRRKFPVTERKTYAGRKDS